MAKEDKTVGSRRNNKDNHSTQKAARNDAHATAKARGRGKGKTTDDSDRTLKPYEASNDSTLRSRMSKRSVETTTSQWPDSFDLEGKTYKNEGVLSNSSGEAIVFTVSRGGKKYALKIYYYDPAHRPDHKILEKIRQLSDSGLLVNIISHGEWKNPNREGEINDYELMDFCEGGSLDGVILEGNEKALAEVAVRMASAIDFLARHGIIHRDIKPANFFYADKGKTRIVLADFGISMECPQGGTVKIDEMRSPVYAAPEFYTNVPGEPAEVGVESDYFSLGVSLLCLWMGKDKLTAKESKLLHSKLTESLPMPKNMSDHMTSLIKALTRLKMNDRATFDDIVRWAKGESLNPQTTSEARPAFHVVFNSSKNQVANSPEELARLLIEEPTLGKKYLYSGRVTRWLEETGLTEVGMNVEEIVETLYPSDQEAGLWAVAYMLDPTIEYVAPDGKSFSDPAELSMYIAETVGVVREGAVKKDYRMKIYLRSHGLHEIVNTVEEYLDSIADADDPVKPALASYYLAILIQSGLPLLVYSFEDGLISADTIEEFLAIIHKNYKENDDNIGYFNWYLLKSPMFVEWLAGIDPALAGKIRLLQTNSTDDSSSPYYNSDSPYRILYELDPRTDFYFNTDTEADDRCYTIEQIGEYMEDYLGRTAEGEVDIKEFMGFLFNFKDTQVADYLRSKGKNYMAFISWMEECLDTESKENKSKPGPYDLVIGAYRGVAGFLGRAPYYPIAGVNVYTLDELEEIPANIVAQYVNNKKECVLNGDGDPQKWVDSWLTVFFQENPALDRTPQFTYENETVKYIECLSQYTSDNYYLNRYYEAIADIDSAAMTLKKGKKGVKFGQWFFMLTCGLPSLIMIIGLALYGLPDVNPIKGHIVATFLICTVGASIFNAALWGVGFWTTIVPGAIAGAVLTLVFYLFFAFSPDLLNIVIIAVLALGLLYRGYKLLRTEKANMGGARIEGDEFEYRQLDALYYAYRDTNNTLENVVTKYAEMQAGYDYNNRSNISYYGWRWAGVVWMLVALWYFWTPGLSGDKSWTTEIAQSKAKAGEWVLGQWEFKLSGSGTRIVCTIDSLVDGEKIYGTMKIGNQAPVPALGAVRSKNDTVPASFNFRTETGSFDKQNLTAEYKDRSKTMEGYYYDRKGIMYQITFLSTPITKGKSAAKSSSAPAAKSNKKKKSEAAIATEVPAESQPESAETSSEEKTDAPKESWQWQDTM